MSAEKTLLHSLTISLRWLDIDPYGHVGNARYYDFMDDARISGFARDILDDLSLQYVVAKSDCEYKKPLLYPNDVVVKLYLERMGNSSFTLCYDFFTADDPDTLCARGHTVMVCYDTKLKTAVRVPESVRELFLNK